MRAIVRKLAAKAGWHVEGRTAKQRREAGLKGVAVLLMDPCPEPGAGAEAIVFSRDRAMQLHAFLGSWFACAITPCPMTVLYTTSPAHEPSYEQLRALWKGRVEFVRETSFREDLLTLVRSFSAPRLVFFTDDGMFLDPFDFDDAARHDPRQTIFALTKGRGLRHCFVTDAPQELPTFLPPTPGDEELLAWRWMDGAPGDWSYPLSVDGHVFSRHELSILLEAVPFTSPNTLESAMQVFQPFFAPRRGMCFPREKLVNIPANTVQTDWRNRDTGLHTTADLLAKWNAGLRIEHEAFRAMNCRDAETSAYRFVAR